MRSLHLNSQTKRCLQGLLLVAVLLASLVGGRLSIAQAQTGGAPELFSAATATADAAARVTPDFVTRSRFVSVDLGLLMDARGQARDASALPEIKLNLFPDLSYVGLIDQVEKNSATSTSWTGKLKGVENGYFFLVVSDGTFIAHLASPEGVFEISSVGANLYQVVQIDQSKLPEDAKPKESSFTPVLDLDPAAMGPNADSGATIDVLVVYTSAARAAEGSVSAMNARVDLAVTETNTAYANSGVTPRLRLVYKGELAYSETGNISTDLDRLRYMADGYLDQVHTLRDSYKADLVVLVVENGGGYCGEADAILAVAATAFSVTARNGCMTGYYSFGHVLGHLQGARHDAYDDPGVTPYAYGHGFINLSSRWRTVMAANTQCTDIAPYSNCTRLQYFSNPTKTYGGAAMGVTNTSENYKVLNNTAVTMANFRTSSGLVCLQGVERNDFNNDCKTDLAVYRPSTGEWLVKDWGTTVWGLVGDVQVAGDYNGDGSTDLAVYRPSTGQWFVKDQFSTTWGIAGDIPVPGDYNGDGKTDIAVFRPSAGQWYVKDQFSANWGISTDLPVPADYNGDGKMDIAVFRPSTAQWYVKDQFAVTWGATGDIPVPGHYNSDGKLDIAVYRPSTGYWIVKDLGVVLWGLTNDVPVPGDYNGDGVTDMAVYRPSTGDWYVQWILSTTWGSATDKPIPARRDP
jgi:hypothetical protein